VATRRKETTEATRSALIDAARGLFAEHGYSDVSTEDVVREARVSRGALYHHFSDKRDLFRAVFERVDHQLVAELTSSLDVDDPWERFNARWEAFLDACVSDRAVQRIVFVDAPAVLGWEEWRKLDAGHALGAVVAGLEEAMDAGLIERRPATPLAHILLGALNEAGMVIANSRKPARARASVAETVRWLLERMRVTAAGTTERSG
jgi:AcrR family transcriptional regulator